MNDKSIQKFWKQFLSVSQEIIENPNDNEIIEKVDKMVYSLGEYDWEYGPSETRRYYFALSPNLRTELLKNVDFIVSRAPAIPNWEIISCKPRKNEFLAEWEMLNELKEKIIVKTENWECIIYKFPDTTYDLDIVVDNVDGNDETKYVAVDIHLSNVLGERKYIECINAVKIIREFPKDIRHKAVFVKYLNEYIPTIPLV